jgi:hypothetical protein
MSWKAETHKIYEARVVNDSLARLAERLDLKGLPFWDEELKTLARRSREAFRNPEKRKERLDGYKAHLAKKYGVELVANISAVLQQINNEIGYYEKK